MTNNISKRTTIGSNHNWQDKREQEVYELESTPRSIFIRVATRSRGDRIPAHTHGWGQLLYARSGLMTADTMQGTWVIPPHRAVWIPPHIEHEVRFLRKTNLNNLYLSSEAPVDLPAQCCMVGVSPLLRELIREASSFPVLYDETGGPGRLISVLLDQIGNMQLAPIHLPWPTDKQLQIITDHLRTRPSENLTLEQWANNIGASSRTLNRKFRQQTGMTFGEWRQQARLLSALVQLAENTPVSLVADHLGYASQSAFISMFRRATGQTPAQYFKDE